ncbi:amidase domain-containing protein [Agromyces sp. GXS1127]|uniref:amidase domain-containing protein n=1 Tax=Agromyces sp. GXS1127 TaxID=3424181 RepID=UPI003D32000B
MPKNLFLPALRRSTYRSPEPDAARDFDLTQPPGSADPVGRRTSAPALPEDVPFAATDPEQVEGSKPEASRSTFTPATPHDSTVPVPAEPIRGEPAAAPAAAGSDAAARTGGVRTLGDGARLPRHRADRRGNRRPSSGRRPLLVACAAFLLGGAVVGGALVDGAEQQAVADASARDAAIEELEASAADRDVVIAPVPDDRPVVTTELSAGEAPFTGGTQVTVEGRNLDEVAEVTVAGTPAEIVESDATAITFAVPAVDDGVRGDAEVVLADGDGSEVDVEVPVASAPASMTTSIQGIVEASAPLEADEVDRTPLAITYTDDPGIEAQVSYVLAHWSSYNTAEYAVLSGVDCANFASQSLIARGWTMDAAWNYDRGTGRMTSAWSSSTALRDYLRTRTDVATELTDAQRGEVKVGDIAQFDWDGSGDRDHTAVVTRVEHTDDGTRVWVGGHTKDADYWDVDVALATGGGSVSYFSLG